jgi:hypothetical protein
MSWRGGGHRIAAALALALLLASPLAALGPRGSDKAPAPSPWSLDALWAWARAWLGLQGSRTAPPAATDKTYCEGGGSIDPDGRPVCTSTASGSTEGGGSIDPNG